MNRSALSALLLFPFVAAAAVAQESAARALASPAKAKNAAPARTVEKDPIKAALGGNAPAAAGAPVTTEVYAEEAFFDSEKYIGTFSGRVIVTDPRFNIQADKLTVYLGKGEARGLEKAIAEGNVGVVRDRPGENGEPPTRSVARAERAVYTTSDGNVELSGTPRVQSGLNTHIATTPGTVMVINESGQLTTRGPSRTEIRQEPKTEPAAKP